MLEDEYCSSNGSGDEECASLTVAIGTACLVGAILGQLTFGYVGDCLGRGPALRLTMVLSVLGALVSAFAVPIGEDPKVRRGAVWRRGYTGLGFVGVWPMACTVCSVQCYSVHR
jgi:PHS family inorganic phosphate transporter-like MFS transporter